MSIDWMPMLVAILTITGAALTYTYQRSVDRRTALVELRRTAYRNYLHAFMAMSDSPDRFDDIRRAYYSAEVDLLVVGSDGVVKSVGALSKFYADTNADRFNRDVNTVRRLVAEVCQSMREDCFEKSALTIDDVKALVPIA